METSNSAKRYEAFVVIDNELKKITFETKENPIEYLWGKYGMSTYIERTTLLGGQDSLKDKQENDCVLSDEDDQPDNSKE